MRFLSVCSGIDAASVAWNPLGWRSVGFAELDKFCSAVLQHHYPDVRNYGDMTSFREWDLEPGSVDVVVGGTPCQSFSVAGLRGGLDDDRGNLALNYCQLLDYLQPRWFVWENVPGVLSTNKGDDLKSILDGFEQAGYIIDIDILDAQFFGVPQRRRRVFVCGQHAETLLKTKTSLSVLTMGQCLVEILHGTCKEELNPSGIAHQKSVQAHLSKDGLQRRMRLFGLTTSQEGNSKRWHGFLEEEMLRCASEVKSLVLERGERQDVDFTLEDRLTAFVMDALSTLTAESWRSDWEESLKVARSFITRTSIKEITQKEICTCFRVVLNIAALILHLKDSSPTSLGAVSSVFAALQDFTNYARPADRNLFTELDGISPLRDLYRQARHLIYVVGHLGDWRCSAAALFERESLSGDSKKGGKAGKDVAGAIGAGFGSSGVDAEQIANGNCVVAFDPTQITSPTNGSNPQYGDPCHSLSKTGHIPAVAYQCQGSNVGEMGTLRAGNGNVTGGVPFIPYHSTGAGYWQEGMGTLRARPQESHEHLVARSYRIAGDGCAYDSGDKTATLTTSTDKNANIITTSTGSTSHCLNAGGMSRQDYETETMVAYMIHSENSGAMAGGSCPMAKEVEQSRCLDTKGGFSHNQGGNVFVDPTFGVRRLTATECERLMGFPDSYTAIPWRGKTADQCPDGPRYTALGNSMAIPCMQYIGRRIALVENVLKRL
jgi:DNA-cytosine methyltransferase